MRGVSQKQIVFDPVLIFHAFVNVCDELYFVASRATETQVKQPPSKLTEMVKSLK
jgi:hypothetical protein